MMLWEKLESDPELSFEIVTTLDDHLVFSRYFHRLPEQRQRQIDWLVGYAVMLPVVALVACFALLLVLRGGSCDLDEALGADSRGRFYCIILAALAGAHALAALALWLRRRANLATSIRTQLTRRLGIDPADPTLAERTVVTLHAAGFRFATESGAYAGGWTTALYFAEEAEHFFLMADRGLGFIVPKRDLAPATTLTVRDMMLAFRQAKRP